MSGTHEDSPRGGSRGNKSGRGGGGGGGGARNRPAPSLEVRISKALSYTLRHGAAKEGLALRPDGYANIAELLAMNKFRSLGVTFPQLRAIVDSNDKQRFALLHVPDTTTTTTTTTATTTATTATDNDDDDDDDDDPTHYLIRANQGHSIALSASALELTPLDPAAADFPATCVHGSFYAFFAAIVGSGGLRAMGRTHVHLSELGAYEAGGVVSGMRADAEVVFVVDARRAAVEGGCRFWRSRNGVVLTEGDADGVVAMRFVDRVEERKKRGGVLWEGGEVVGEVPAGKRMPPRGKEHVVRRGGGGRGRGRGGGRGQGEVEERTIDAGDV